MLLRKKIVSKKKKTSVGKPECILGLIYVLSQGGWMCGKQTLHSPSGKFIQPGAFSRYTFFPRGPCQPSSSWTAAPMLHSGFGAGSGCSCCIEYVCTANPALPGSTGSCWGQQVRRVTVQLSMDPRKGIMMRSGTCRCLGFGSGWLKYYHKVPFWDLLCIDWCLIWNLLAWKKNAWQYIVNSLGVQCFKATVLCSTSLAQ